MILRLWPLDIFRHPNNARAIDWLDVLLFLSVTAIYEQLQVVEDASIVNDEDHVNALQHTHEDDTGDTHSTSDSYDNDHNNHPPEEMRGSDNINSSNSFGVTPIRALICLVTVVALALQQCIDKDDIGKIKRYAT